MSKSLVIVESPAKAKTISKYLGSEYIVQSSVGHIRDLPKKGTGTSKRSSIPKNISPEEKARLKVTNDRKRLIRRMGIDPDNGWKADWQIIPEKEKVLKSLKKAAKNVDNIFLATDLDREGEAIAWHLKEALGSDKYNYSRVRFNQITKDAILESFSDPKEIDLNLVKAYRARRFLDKVIGFELSPLLWKKIARGLSAGRVQSVALRLLDEKERSIQEFIPEEFWEIYLYGSTDKNEKIKFNLLTKKNDPLLNQNEVEEIKRQIESTKLVINEIVKKPVKIKPKAPFITSTLQQSASTRLGFNVKRTMRVAQKLYEGGLITYMRTDAPSLSKESINEARNFVNDNLGENYLTNSPRIYSGSENAQEAHEAIRPTNSFLKPKDVMNLSEEESRLYSLIWERFIASQLPDAEYLSTSAKVYVGEKIFVARGRELVFDGFTRVLKTSSKEEDILPSLQEGQLISMDRVELEQKFTKPPARYSEAALVRELEKKGIGRPSTYANIISTIQDRGYVQIENKRFFVKKIGHIVAERLIESFHDIMDYDFTANLENSLDEVANGEADWRHVLDNFYKSFQNDLISASDEDSGMRPGNIPTTTDIICPLCEKTNMVIRNSSNGVFLGCSGYQNEGNDKCKETLNLISGDEAVSVDDSEEAENLLIKKRCPKCDTSMDNYLIDEFRKLHVCGKNPDCNGYLVEDGKFKIKGYDGPTLECHKCGSEMQLKTGRFGKYFGCLNDNCGATRALQRNGEPKPITMEPIEIPDLKCIKCEDHYLLRDSMKGLFLAASQYPKNRETRAPKVSEINKLHNEIIEACRFLPNKEKHMYLLEAPEKDVDGNPYIIRYNRTDDVHYLASEKDGKKTKWTATYSDGEWVQNLKS